MISSSGKTEASETSQIEEIGAPGQGNQENPNFPFKSLKDFNFQDDRFKDKGIIKSGKEFAELLEDCYKKGSKSLKEVLSQASGREIVQFIESDDFLNYVADNLNYRLLDFALLYDKCSGGIGEKLDQNSKLLNTFFHNLVEKKIRKKEKVKIMVALLCFNKEEVEAAVRKHPSVDLHFLFPEAMERLKEEENMWIDKRDDSSDSDNEGISQKKASSITSDSIDEETWNKQQEKEEEERQKKLEYLYQLKTKLFKEMKMEKQLLKKETQKQPLNQKTEK